MWLASILESTTSEHVVALNMFVAVEWGMTHPSVDMPEWNATAGYFFLGFFSVELFIKLMVHALYFFRSSSRSRTRVAKVPVR